MRHGQIAALTFIVILFGGCLYDSEQRCARNQRLDERDRCACIDGAVPDRNAGGCSPCGANEAPLQGVCACTVGYARSGEGQACAPIPDGLGTACTATIPCAGRYDHCATGLGGDSYCTSKGCTNAADCPMGYVCDASTATTFCRRPPTGQGKACAAMNDCQGLDASYCETFVLKACVMDGCSVSSPTACHTGLKCCDVSALGLPKTLCLAVEACP